MIHIFFQWTQYTFLCVQYANILTCIHQRNLFKSDWVNNIRRYKLQRVKMYLLTWSPNEDSNKPAHLRSLIRLFVICMKKLCKFGFLKCAQGRFRTACALAQADLNHPGRTCPRDVSWRCGLYLVICPTDIKCRYCIFTFAKKSNKASTSI